MPSSCCRLCSAVEVQLSWLPSLRLSKGAPTLRAVSSRLSAHACKRHGLFSWQVHYLEALPIRLYAMYIVHTRLKHFPPRWVCLKYLRT